MWGWILSALSWLVNWIFRTVVMKFIVMTCLYYVITSVINWVSSKLDFSSVNNLQSTVNNIPATLLYFLGVFRADIGLPLVIGAMFVRFIIRRLPIIG